MNYEISRLLFSAHGYSDGFASNFNELVTKSDILYVFGKIESLFQCSFLGFKYVAYIFCVYSKSLFIVKMKKVAENEQMMAVESCLCISHFVNLGVI